MKKFILLAVAAAMLAMAPAVQAADRQPGGFAAGMVGCCFGHRTGAAWNNGKNINIRDILDIIFVGRIWSFFTVYGGMSYSDLHKSEPAYY